MLEGTESTDNSGSDSTVAKKFSQAFRRDLALAPETKKFSGSGQRMLHRLTDSTMTLDSALGISSGVQIDGNRLVGRIRDHLDTAERQSCHCGFARDAGRLHFDNRPQSAQFPLFLNRQGHPLLTDCYS